MLSLSSGEIKIGFIANRFTIINSEGHNSWQENLMQCIEYPFFKPVKISSALQLRTKWKVIEKFAVCRLLYIFLYELECRRLLNNFFLSPKSSEILELKVEPLIN